tara:strand:+ start:13232 stop:13789 length:558 start_codon:yes stop_codon:yes gene_type:complete
MVPDSLREYLETIGQLDQPTQAFALMGYYLSTFTEIEMSLNELFGQLLRLDWPQQRIVTANMAFADKVHTVRALFRETALPAEYKREGDKLLARLVSDFAAERNKVAHGFIFGHGYINGGALIPTFRAKGKVDDDTFLMTIEDAILRLSDMMTASGHLLEMATNTKAKQADLEAVAAIEMQRIRM